MSKVIRRARKLASRRARPVGPDAIVAALHEGRRERMERLDEIADQVLARRRLGG